MFTIYALVTTNLYARSSIRCWVATQWPGVAAGPEAGGVPGDVQGRCESRLPVLHRVTVHRAKGQHEAWEAARIPCAKLRPPHNDGDLMVPS